MSNRFLKIAVLPMALIFVAAIMLALHSASTHALRPNVVTIAKSVDSHTCLAAPAPVGTLELPPLCVAGDVITYTIVVRTDITDTVVMTDPLPMYTDPFYFDPEGDIVFPGGGAIGSGTVLAGVYTWQGEMPAGSAVTLTLAIQVSADAQDRAPLGNTAFAMGLDGVVVSSTAGEGLMVWGRLLLPHAMKDFSAP